MTDMSHPPFRIHEEGRASRWLITCDHASNAVPPEIGGGSLGLAPEDMARHIAWDPGAAGVSLALADALGAPAILGNFSRLVIDPNRGEDDPTLIMPLYDGTIVPGNRHLDAAERERRLEAYYRPYHRAVERLAARRDDTIFVAIHSYTRQLRGRDPRPWHIGVLYGKDARFALPLLERLRAEPDLCVGENEPYGGHLDGDSVDRHAIGPGRLNVLIEIRNDLIETPAQQRAWGTRLAPILEEVLEKGGFSAENHASAGHIPARTNGPEMDAETRVQIEAAAFRRLQKHLLQDRPEVQNIDLMNLAGFCRNCLSRWMQEAAAERGIKLDKAAAREMFYGQPYDDWKAAHQREASAEKQSAFKVAFAENVGKDAG